MFKRISIRLSVMFLLECVLFFLLNANNFTIDILTYWFLLWALISIVLFSINIANLSIFAPLRMIGGNQQAQNLAGEAAERMVGSYKEKYKFFFKLNDKHLTYLICSVVNLILYIVFKLLI